MKTTEGHSFLLLTLSIVGKVITITLLITVVK